MRPVWARDASESHIVFHLGQWGAAASAYSRSSVVFFDPRGNDMSSLLKKHLFFFFVVRNFFLHLLIKIAQSDSRYLGLYEFTLKMLI